MGSADSKLYNQNYLSLGYKKASGENKKQLFRHLINQVTIEQKGEIPIKICIYQFNFGKDDSIVVFLGRKYYQPMSNDASKEKELNQISVPFFTENSLRFYYFNL